MTRPVPLCPRCGDFTGDHRASCLGGEVSPHAYVAGQCEACYQDRGAAIHKGDCEYCDHPIRGHDNPGAECVELDCECELLGDATGMPKSWAKSRARWQRAYDKGRHEALIEARVDARRVAAEFTQLIAALMGPGERFIDKRTLAAAEGRMVTIYTDPASGHLVVEVRDSMYSVAVG